MIGPGGMSRAVRNLLIVNIAAFIPYLLPSVRGYLIGLGSLIPSYTFFGGQVWRLATYMFIHGGPFHLAFNMLALWMFGVELEQYWGSRKFTVFYFAAGIGAGLFSLLLIFSPAMRFVPIVGASGAILGILTMYAYYFPDRTLLMFFVFPMPVRLAVAVIGLISLVLSMGTLGGIAHITHLGGIVVALLYIRFNRPVSAWLDSQRRHHRERQMRSNAEDNARRDRYFRDVIDPILAKLSKSGMDSLTKQEKKLLFEASRKDRKRFDSKGGIIPFDFK